MFSNKVILITGASSGIGATTAVHFASEGAKLAITGRNAKNLNETADKCLKNGKHKPLTIIADLNNDEDVKKIIDATIKTYGTLDILINNAGTLVMGPIENSTLEQYDSIFTTNVRSIYLLTKLAIPYLVKTEGNIVNVSSLAGLRPFSGAAAYCMSKSALDQFTRCSALEFAPQKVRVNSVNPGVIETNLQKSAGLTGDVYDQFMEGSKKCHPLGRLGKSEEVSDAISFLASNKASFITGVTLSVDGGYCLAGPQ